MLRPSSVKLYKRESAFSWHEVAGRSVWNECLSEDCCRPPAQARAQSSHVPSTRCGNICTCTDKTWSCWQLTFANLSVNDTAPTEYESDQPHRPQTTDPPYCAGHEPVCFVLGWSLSTSALPVLYWSSLKLLHTSWVFLFCWYRNHRYHVSRFGHK